MEALLRPIRLGDIECRNRIVMAPCTRCMSPGFRPTEDVVRYYARRAEDGVGLLISEGTVISPRGNGYPDVPGLFEPDQVEAWRAVTSAVRAAGGAMICQIWHVGAVAHPRTTLGATPEGPSGVSPEGEIRRLRGEDGSKVFYGPSEAMSAERIVEVIDEFRRAAANALEAGFDGVEIHGAHSYLIDQFTSLAWNRRDDEWGGPHRTRFAGEVARAVVGEAGAGRVGFRFSPKMSVAARSWQKPAETFPMLLTTLRDAGVRILHASNLDYDEPIVPSGALSAGARESGSESQDLLPLHRAARRAWEGQLIGVGGLSPARADDAIAAGEIDMAAFGRSLIANPDFVSRVREGRPLRAYEPKMLETLR